MKRFNFGYKPPKEYSRPLPELLDGEDWEARNSNDLKKAYVDFDKGEFVVPFMAGNAGEFVRAHEAMHVKISPHRHSYSDADFVTYQAVEDTRVNLGLRIADIRTDNARVYTDKEINEHFMEPESRIPIRLGEAYFATKGLDEAAMIRKIIEKERPEVLPIAEEVMEKYFGDAEMNNYLPSNEDVNNCVKELKKRLEELNTPEEQNMQLYSGVGKASRQEMNMTQSWVPGKGDAYAEKQDLPVITEEESKEIGDALPHYTMSWHGENGPGEMEITKPKFDSLIKFKKVRAVKTAASDEGVIPTRMYRYASDMRIFTSKGKRRTNAAVLVDVSGSMSLSAHQVEEIIKLSPASIVAIYSAKGRTGELRIVAEKGRFYSPLNRNMGHSNVVDFHALKWLAARKEKKKLWISDGYVTGIGDSQLDPVYVRKIVNLVQRYRIERVGDVKDLIESGTLIDRSFDDGHQIAEYSAARVEKIKR